jgi:RNA polymerase sigma-70 factor, ECF subfamily
MVLKGRGRFMADAETRLAEAAGALSADAVKRYTLVLHRYLLQRLRHRREDADDLTQEIFERFLRKRDREKMVRNPLAYLYGIASHVVAETLEQEPRQLVRYDSELADYLAEINRGEGLDDLARSLGLSKDLMEAMQKLPQAHLTALMLVEVDGLTCKEASRECDYTPDTIRTYVRLARATLKKLLDDYWSRKA